MKQEDLEEMWFEYEGIPLKWLVASASFIFFICVLGDRKLGQFYYLTKGNGVAAWRISVAQRISVALFQEEMQRVKGKE